MEEINVQLVKSILARSAPKSDEFYVMRAVLPRLPLETVVSLMDFSFNQKKYITELFASYLENQWQPSCQREYTDLLDTLQNAMAQLASYLPLHRAAVLASTILRLTGNPAGATERCTSSMLESPYRSIRSLAYGILLLHFSIQYRDRLVHNWHKYYDEKIIDIVLAYPKDFVDTDLPADMIKYIEPDDPGDFVPLNELIQRNLLASIQALKDPSIAERYRERDPISYIFICKTNKISPDPATVLRQFQTNERTRRYLPTWMAESGQYSILNGMMEQLESEDAGGS